MRARSPMEERQERCGASDLGRRLVGRGAGLAYAGRPAVLNGL
ncbi:hypothetical protein TRIP_B350420 [uncultured Desulfatiglans sp.]|uniref:Uncharacterized protein n=1 Tax=Uncultured Desulfatiglans sp. TaxID=1748965 RepID=A0A653AC39_UNCDX|nr:hypothetical protein TRIP_B350420 [uncultured Desulfatiglans sp.]